MRAPTWNPSPPTLPARWPACTVRLSGTDQPTLRSGKSARPDFASLNYPVVTMGNFTHAVTRKCLLGDTPTPEQLAQYSNELLGRADMPPTFLIHAADDASVPVDNSLMMFSAIRRVKVDAALHVFEKGGHGFGLDSRTGPTVQGWPELFAQWATARQLFRPAP